MKKCPFCAEDIQDEAIKCRHCGEFLDKTHKSDANNKWYFSTSAIVIGLATLGPLALPLVWFNPKYNAAAKIIVTIAIFALTYFLCYLMGKAYQNLVQELNNLGLNQLQ